MTRVMDRAGWGGDYCDDDYDSRGLSVSEEIRIVEKMLRYRKHDDPKVLARDIADLFHGA